MADLPMTLKEAAEPMFHCSYDCLRQKVKYLISIGCPLYKEGNRYMVYPKHLEAWRISRYSTEAKRGLRHGGYDVQDKRRA